jgi:hypothetical protein
MTRHGLFTLIGCFVLALGAGAQSAHLEAGHPSLLSSSPVYATASGAQRVGAIVPTSEGWIAVWSDDLAQPPSSDVRRLLGTRLRPDGTVIDTTGIQLASDNSYAIFTATPHADGVRVYWIGGSSLSGDIQAVDLSSLGEVSTSIVVAHFAGDRVPARLTAAVSGSRTGLLFSGKVILLEGDRYLRTIDLGGFGEPSSIVATTTHFVVSWTAAGGVLMVQTLDLDGNLTGPAGGTGVDFPAESPSLATDGSRVLLAWSNPVRIGLAVIDPATGTIVHRSDVAVSYPYPRAVWTGASYLVAWAAADGSGLFGVRVSPAGDPIDAESRKLYDGSPSYLTLAASGDSVMMLHETGGCFRSYCETDVWATPLGGDSPPTRLLSASARAQISPAVESNGTGFLSLWNEAGSFFATRTNVGERAPTAPFQIGDANGSDGALASDGHDYLAAWIAYRGSRYFIEGAPVSGEGETPPARSFSIDAGNEVPIFVSVGGAPDLYLVVWRETGVQHAARVKVHGELVDTVPLTLVGSNIPWVPAAVAFDGRDFVVAWNSAGTGTDPQSRVETQRVTTGGTVSFDRLWATGPSGSILASSLGCAIDSCLVVWTERGDPYGATWLLRGQRFRTGGETIDDSSFLINVAELNHASPTVSWDGSRFVVTWGGYDKLERKMTVEARTIPTSGPIDQAGGLADRLAESYPATPAACNRDGRCLLLNTGPIDDSLLGRGTRLFKRFFGAARLRGVRR